MQMKSEQAGLQHPANSALLRFFPSSKKACPLQSLLQHAEKSCLATEEWLLMNFFFFRGTNADPLLEG